MPKWREKLRPIEVELKHGTKAVFSALHSSTPETMAMKKVSFVNKRVCVCVCGGVQQRFESKFIGFSVLLHAAHFVFLLTLDVFFSFMRLCCATRFLKLILGEAS